MQSISVKQDISPLLKLSIPLVLAGIMQSATSFFGNIFLAKLGAEYLAAGALVSWLFATLIVIIFGTLGSVNVLVSYKHGENDVAAIGQIWRSGLMLALLVTIPISILLWKIAPVFLLLGQHPLMVTLVTPYLHALAFGVLPNIVMLVMMQVLIGLGLARTVTIYVCSTVSIYVFFSWALIFGKCGLPELGIAGAGWGLTIGDWIANFILCAYIFLSAQFKPYLKFLFSGKLNYLREIITLGLPMGMMYCIELGFFLTMTILMGRINIQSLSANQLTMQYLGPLMGTIFSIAQGLTTRMGHEIGANQVEAAKRAIYVAVMIVFIYMSVVAVFYWMAPNVLIAADFKLTDPANQLTIQLAREFIFVAAFFQIIEAVRITLYGALRGFKETHYSLLASVISFWGIALPIGYFLSMLLKLGGVGFWWGMVIGAMCSVVLLYKRLKFKMSHLVVLGS